MPDSSIPSASLWGCELKYWKWKIIKPYRCQPPCEAVSWNIHVDIYLCCPYSQPPCEAVSWNTTLLATCNPFTVSLLVRLWVEMFDYWNIFRLRKVSLLVRLWVEILRTSESLHQYIVSLLVRLWVEILLPTALKSAVRRQPPCEAVSWNIWFWLCCCSSTVSLLVRLWVEIIFCHHYTMLRFVSLLVRLWVEITIPQN